jgi:iron complex transport system permease protein
MTTGRLTARRFWLVVAAAIGCFVVAAAIALFFGRTDTASALHFHWLDLSDPLDRSIFRLIRLPRAAGAAVAGAGLAAAGVAFQGVLRNPLADPYTLGVSSGSSLGAVIALRFGVDTLLGTSGVAAAAFLGAMGAIFVIWNVARVGSSRPPAILLLAGVTLAFLCSSATMFLQYTAGFETSGRIVHWLMGGLEWVTVHDLAPAACVVLAGLVALLWISRDLNPLSAGPDAAASVGVPVGRTVAVAFVGGAVVVGAVVAVAGPIGFVGLMVPHAVRALAGSDHRVLLPASIFGGAAFVLAADTAARLILWPSMVPVGVLTALSGGGFFLYLLLGEKRRARLWSG